MTDSEREELVYDISQAQLKATTKSQVWAFATDRLCELLLAEPDEVLLKLHDECVKKSKPQKKSKPSFGFQ